MIAIEPWGNSFESEPVKKEEEKLIITLDGPSGSGKSTLSHRLAAHFSVPCLDTGAMYRMVALRCIQQQIPLDDDAQVTGVARHLKFRFIPGSQGSRIEVAEGNSEYRVVGKEIRTPEVSMGASQIAKLKSLRQELVRQQQRIGQEVGAVVEGRDAGTVIFPQAKFKFFMTASTEERAKRRHKELVEKWGNEATSYEEVLSEMMKRDAQDSQRAESPLKAAEDADLVDTTGLAMDEVLGILISRVQQKRRPS